jgi:hypothetical protein
MTTRGQIAGGAVGAGHGAFGRFPQGNAVEIDRDADGKIREAEFGDDAVGLA